MRQLLGIGIIAVGIYMFYFAEAEKTICKTREDFVATSLMMVFDQKVAENMGNAITESEIGVLLNRDPRIGRVKTPYANAADFQAGCDAIDEVVKRYLK